MFVSISRACAIKGQKLRFASNHCAILGRLTAYQVAMRQLDFERAEDLIATDLIVTLPRAEAEISRYVELMGSKMSHTSKQARQAYERSQRVSILFCLVALGGTFLLAWLFTRSLTGPIGHAVRVAERIAGNDLTQPVKADGNDEMTCLLNALGTMQATCGRP